MKFQLTNPIILADAVSIMSELVNDIRIKFKPEGLEVVAIDPANVAMLTFKMPSSLFREYETSGEEVIGISLDDLKNVLRRGKNILKAETKENRLYLEFGGGAETTNSGEKKSFVLSLLGLEGEEKKIPQWKFPIKLIVGALKLQEAINDASIITDNVSFISGKEGFMLEAKSSLHSATIQITSEKLEEVKAKYSLDYLQRMVKASRISDDVIINYANDHPLFLQYQNTQNVEINFILAPRVETD